VKIAVWACALAVASVVANAQDYPSQPIRLVVGYPAGGSIDVGARLIGQKLSDILGQPFVIENRTGASGAVAAEFVARSVPDGYTILLQPGDFFTTASLLPNLPFDPNKDLLPIAMVTDNPLVIAAAAHAPFNTVKEFIAAAKISPTGFTYATVGVATSNNVVGQWIGLETHAKMVHVPYRSGPDAALATISGDVNVVITSPASIYPGLVDAGKVKVIALTGTDHPSYLPASWPTLAENGLSIDATLYGGLFGPIGMPEPIIARLQRATETALQDDAVRARLISNGINPKFMAGTHLAARIRADTSRFESIMRAVGMQTER
jgi:tripartite-type tricarboxylate transporter receptor subunit TctC